MRSSHTPFRLRAFALALAFALVMPLAACGGGSGEDLVPPPNDEMQIFPLLPDHGLFFEQVAFNFEQIQMPFSRWGRMRIEILQVLQAAFLQQGFINVLAPDTWVVQNLPLGFGNLDETAVYFDLGNQAGQPVNALDLRVFITEQPIMQLPPEMLQAQPTPFDVQPFPYNAEGRGPMQIQQIPEPPIVRPLTYAFPTFGIECVATQQVVNVQAANDQCGPMSIANSLQYLENIGAISVPHAHDKGLNGDNTLVGQLGNAMGRGTRSRADGDTVGDAQFMNGKFQYESDNGINLNHRFQQETDQTYIPTDANNEYTAHGLKAKDESARTGITFDWIAARVKAGDDVEAGVGFDGGGGHWVRIDGVMKINGIPFIRYSHDASQTDSDPNDNKGLETVWVPLVDTDGDGKLNLAAGTELELVVAEGK